MTAVKTLVGQHSMCSTSSRRVYTCGAEMEQTVHADELSVAVPNSNKMQGVEGSGSTDQSSSLIGQNRAVVNGVGDTYENDVDHMTDMDQSLPSTDRVEETQAVDSRDQINIVDKPPSPFHATTEPHQSADDTIKTEISDTYDDEYSDDFEDGEDDDDDDDSGDESDVEDNTESYVTQRLRRQSNPELPHTVTTLETEFGSKVYLVGTAHFSLESQMDVAQVITATQPDVVMVELCNSRVNILQLDEDTLLEEARNINMDKIRTAIKQSGLVQGIMHLLLLSMSAHLTKQLGMAPGGEFRKAFTEAQKVPGCRIQLGDRPIQITLRRALGSLSWWQKLRLAFYILTSKEPISKEEVEKCKQKDLLEQMLKEMTGEFPALSAVFVQERDIFLANSLSIAAQPIQHPDSATGFVPSVVVGVVGIGHVTGIKANWGKKHNIKEIMSVPEASKFGTILRWSFRASFVIILSYGCYRMIRWTAGSIL